MKPRLWALLPLLTTLSSPVLASPAQNDFQGAPPSLIAPLPPTATGYTVLGRVTCGDTQRAARFAQVTLIAAAESGGGFHGGPRLSARTDLDGNFNIPAVPPGDYYATASLTGYVNTTRSVEEALSSSTDPGSAPAGVPLIHVSAGGASTALTLQRGGVIAGAVQWDDGSPAAGINVSAQPVPPGSNTPGTTVSQLPTTGRGGAYGFGGGFAGAQTDDRGQFRLSGLAPGPYYLRANVQAPAPTPVTGRGSQRILSLSVYAPGRVRRTEAAVITLGAGEERQDVNVVLGLAGLHIVSGVVSASGAAVHSGTVNLTDQTDSSLNRTGSIGPDGSFVVPYVPPGTYTMRINASSALTGNGREGGSADLSARFQPVQESVTVTDGDLSGLSVTVTAATSSP